MGVQRRRMCRERCRERGSGLAPEQEAEKHGFAARLELGSKPNEKRRAIRIARRFHVLLAESEAIASRSAIFRRCILKAPTSEKSHRDQHVRCNVEAAIVQIRMLPREAI